jgi:D-alanyl-D-alanine dipeptidase
MSVPAGPTVTLYLAETLMRLPATLALLLASLMPAAARNALPDGFVYLREVAPAIAQDIRYATADNFTGRPLPGYAAPECVLRREVAQALARVEADLAPRHLGLKVYDCYRPARAVAAMWRWSQGESAGDKRFYPNVAKHELFALGYIASHSRHSAGIAVDLTLIPLSSAPSSSARSRAARDAPCTAPAAARTGDGPLDKSPDMGTGFDCLDAKSYTNSAAVTAEQRRWRNLLKAAMGARGFRNYFREWWHYEYAGAPRHAYDFPIPPR